jgi:hypothetical protein
MVTPRRGVLHRISQVIKLILEAQRIQFPDIARVMSEEECSSSLACTTAAPIITKPMSDQVLAGGGRPHGELIVAAPPTLHSSLEPHVIDNLA